MKTNRIPSLSLAAIALCQVAGVIVHADLISNGSFESPVSPPGLSSVRPTGWSGTGSFGNGLVHGPGVVQSSFQYPNPADGDQFVDIGTGSVTTPFSVTTPGDYILTWSDNSLITGWNGGYVVEILNSSLASVQSQVISYSYLTLSPPWRNLSLILPALGAGNYFLSFGPGSTYTFIDDVSLAPRATGAVPDYGSTGTLLGLAIGVGIFRITRVKR